MAFTVNLPSVPDKEWQCIYQNLTENGRDSHGVQRAPIVKYAEENVTTETKNCISNTPLQAYRFSDTCIVKKLLLTT